MHTWLVLAISAMVLWGITGVTQKLSTNNISFELSFLWFSAAFVPISAVITATAPLDWSMSMPLVGLAALGGALNGLGALTTFAALERGGKSSVVIPIVSLYPLVTLGGAWFLLGERITPVQMLGVACAIGAVFLLAQEAGSGEDRNG